MRVLETLIALRSERLPELRKEYEEALRKAEIPDPRLTVEANDTARKLDQDMARTVALEFLDGLQAEAEDAIGRVRRYAARRAPVPPTEALLAEMRQGKAWDRVRALLEAGRSVQDVIKNADLDTLAALRVELPSYLAAKSDKPAGLAGAGWSDTDHGPLLRLIDRATVPLLPEGRAARVQAGLDLDEIEPGLRVALHGLRLEIEQPNFGHGLHFAVAARMAGQAAAAGKAGVAAELTAQYTGGTAA